MGLDPERSPVTVVDGPVLDAEFTVPRSPAAAAVVAHPHPRFGGSMDVPVVRAIVDALVTAGVAVARFDFRGVGASTGSHGGGIAERDDVLAVAGALVDRAGAVPLWLTGYSFGADVSLSVAPAGLVGWVAVAPPLQLVEGGASTDPRPAHVICAAHDQFCPPDQARSIVAPWPSTSVEVVQAADHFFVGQAETAASRVAEIIAG